MWKAALAIGVLYAYFRLAGSGPGGPGTTVRDGMASLRQKVLRTAGADDGLQGLVEFEAVCPAAVFAARSAMKKFVTDWKQTYAPEAADTPAEHVRRLFAHRSRVLAALHDLRMRLPNDLDVERRLVDVTEAADRAMLERIEDARQRCGAPLVHPGSLGPAWYGQWYRAANDEVV